ncbi:MAG: tRNA-specific 2-thiouridylase MnmA [uncultured Thermomicrobiales bacterium]|uniref:tRNA-specific 2-thiouridylase MnmA n=1 Tax=uncultured Thermomicrobiales bacterium TaxID=1645740 RepID=A0A6J4UG03_9BACT|nr:MAG: tRNA-specific 2-thiouridylase MnmA [uncultured Thermomicrobiales bacterium]
MAVTTLPPIPTTEPPPAPDAASFLTEAKIGPRDGARRTAVIAMSGGVDSAVTALVMRERGYRVVGINLRLFSPGDAAHRANPCCGIPAMDDARATCALLGVPFYAVNMETEFGEAVVDRFVEEYAAGRTPNPCLECNRHVKFRHLVQRARLLGADCLATGHYARVVPGDTPAGRPHRLLRAVDPTKDQSYVLHTMTQDQLGFVRFPLGALRKTEVRTLARHFGLPVADKAESQEICFVGKRSYADFVAARRPDVTRAGEVVDGGGRVLGAHRGLVHHTVGQRRGVGIAGPEPLYVLRLEPAANRLVVGPRREAAALSLRAEAVALTDGAWPEEPFPVEAVVRYRGAPTAATVSLGVAGGGEATVSFHGEGPVASPGQAVVFYRGDEVLGGGTIREVATGT